MLNRRELIKSISTLPLLGGLVGTNELLKSVSKSEVPTRRDYFKELGQAFEDLLRSIDK